MPIKQVVHINERENMKFSATKSREWAHTKSTSITDVLSKIETATQDYKLNNFESNAVNDALEFNKRQEQKIKQTVENLLKDSSFVENQLRLAELEIHRKEEELFFRKQNDKSISVLLNHQQNELNFHKDMQRKMLQDRQTRKTNKKMQSELYKEAKLQQAKLYQQEKSQSVLNYMKTFLTEHRNLLDSHIANVELRHQKQLKQLSEEQERRIIDEKILVEMGSRHLKEEEKNETMKEFNFKQNHRRTVDKKKSEHLRELQMMELRHMKERFEVERQSYEDIFSLKAAHTLKYQEVEQAGKSECSNEKEKIRKLEEAIKIKKIKHQYQLELKRMKLNQKNDLKQIQKEHEEKAKVRTKTWNIMNGGLEAITDELETEEAADGLGGMQAIGGENLDDDAGSVSSINSGQLPDDKNQDSTQFRRLSLSGSVFEEEKSAPGTQGLSLKEDREVFTNEEQLAKAKAALLLMNKRFTETLEQLKTQQAEELSQLQASSASKLDAIDQKQYTEIIDLKRSQRHEIHGMLSIQENELKMEENIRATERKMFLERRMLSSLVDTVIDGVTTIDTNGKVIRFNMAAEKMFGYKAAEVVGNNITMLMPEEFATNHHTYLGNYLSTGIKKVIGVGRYVTGKKKDGSFFPIHLSVSEVKEEDFHIFTGIIRDLTDEKAKQDLAKEAQTKKELELKVLVTELNEAKKKAKSLLNQILPPEIADKIQKNIPCPPQMFSEATIFFSDIVSFTTLASQLTPFQVVALLNGLYSMFDEIICQYDVYKIETIGDSYMVASGIPQKNGNRHAGEIATMALHFVAALKQFRIQDLPDYRLQLRVGINSGSCVAGVVGSKMPRYCLFGDTVNTASRMESTSEAMKIQISQSTYDILTVLGDYEMEKRGTVKVKGKGDMTTYWLTGKKYFNPDVSKSRRHSTVVLDEV